MKINFGKSRSPDELHDLASSADGVAARGVLQQRVHKHQWRHGVGGAAANEHRAIYDAIVDREPDNAAAAMDAHLAAAERSFNEPESSKEAKHT